MINDWRTEIVKAVVVRRHLESRDEIYSYPLPEVAASEGDIQAAEAVVGPLDARHRTFLKHADGWKGFLQKIDLFGTAQLMGAPPMRQVREAIAAVGEEAFSAFAGFDIRDVVPIGGSDSQTDLWLLAKPDAANAGQVLWFWGSDYELYSNFDEFYLAMVDYNRLALQELQ
ncbi:SMI1/KNR4 family protein [Actinoplanes sp. NPDC049681]|uniref:SMI1/KNR4 family protein n=1 Tax=Actinoplanes sp. NPDC049681 TaxID=3363905 RepID=UPI003788EAFC